MKPFFTEPVDIKALRLAGAMAETVHGMEVKQEVTANEFHAEFLKCPWQDAYIALGIPEEWRLCPSGHVAFTENMYKGLTPGARYELSRNMPSGAKSCAAKATI